MINEDWTHIVIETEFCVIFFQIYFYSKTRNIYM